MMGIAGGLGVSLPATAGAVVSGAFFGDKLSPLSDTTNLAPMAAGSELYEHIKHMLYTTVPASLVALVVYLFVGFSASGDLVRPDSVQLMMDQLDTMFNFNIVLLLPFVLVILGSVKKWPTIPTMLGTSLLTSLPATAGAVVSGAFLGDKLSPLSDTTNLAPMAAGSEIYDHIKHMLYTTVPASLVCIVDYLIVGFSASGDLVRPDSVQLMMDQLDTMFNFNIVLLLPFILVILGSVKKWPTIPTMLGTSLLTVVLGAAVQGFNVVDGFTSLISGFNITMTGFTGTPTEEVIKLINRGGVASVTSTTVLIYCAMGFAGIVSMSGMLDVVLDLLMSKVKSTAGIIISTIVSCFTVAFVTGSSYLSILVPGELFKDVYPKKNLHPKNLSRTLEDSGTVLVPLIPWSAAGAYMAATLGVDTLEYLPWAIMNYSGMIFAIIFAITGFGIAKLDKNPTEKEDKAV